MERFDQLGAIHLMKIDEKLGQIYLIFQIFTRMTIYYQLIDVPQGTILNIVKKMI